ncbi:histidinol-phosphate aminotransferase [Ruminiclostridium sufflavum DSM 19573]|uniref:Histidinol-phosphate aminotransferase n=1 Tax=Ruminiclostridium sufflavum DSM 19573 TaxID=1121337 RepID=A0A318XN45_9FIRM|nr:histidinol-phosphate transaminase [Ruminiclostridium sufflavum]PYG88136.1 histidinol-phosphate aminotransferase [Ruminiclostridium sufflavum DSM 19573]
MIEKLIRSEIRSFIPYNANQQPYKIKLDANESPFNLPLKVREKLSAFILENPQLNLYPDTDSIQLRQALAEHWDADEQGIIAGTGSDQLIQLISNVFVGTGDKVIYPVPSFGMYRDSCVIAGGVPVQYLLNPNKKFEYSKETIIEGYEKEQPKIIYICNPNNPTGNIMSREDIMEVARHCRNSVIVVDEAYAEFCDVTVIPYVKEYENLLVLRTFSKAYGLAGIRCGYSISCRKLADAINLARPPYNISSLSQYTAQLVLSEKEEIRENIAYLIAQRERMKGELAGIKGIEVYNSYANFILVKADNCSEVYKRLCEKGIFVRAFGHASLLAGCMRISVGTYEQNTIFLDELSTICYNN